MERKLSQISMEFIGNDPERNHGQDETVIETGEVRSDESSEEQLMMNEPGEKINEPLAKKNNSKRGRPSLKEMNASADLVQIPADEILFQKQYYSIGQVAQWFHVNQSLIRYWETEFDILQPRKNRKGDRFFRPVDVKNLLLIYDLLRRRKFTLEGAKDFLKNARKTEEKFATIQSLEKIKTFFLELKASL